PSKKNFLLLGLFRIPSFSSSESSSKINYLIYKFLLTKRRKEIVTEVPSSENKPKNSKIVPIFGFSGLFFVRATAGTTKRGHERIVANS
ncbi:hypothetical protein MXE60_10165, partial [Enterococcus hirae]|uniref:hypothetical protein n=1 Tax=Enterococcus hirae TaxID=1354 RepID=UPI002DD66841